MGPHFDHFGHPSLHLDLLSPTFHQKRNNNFPIHYEWKNYAAKQKAFRQRTVRATLNGAKSKRKL